MSQGVLVINAGSSSIKFRIFAMQEGKQSLVRVCKGGIEKLRSEAPYFRAVDESGTVLTDTHLAGNGQPDRHRQGLSYVLNGIDGRRDLPDIAAVGHRVVHGGRRHLMPQRVTPALLTNLQELIPLPRRPSGGGPLRLSYRSGTGLPGRRAGELGCPGIHRRHRREQSRHPLAHL